MDEKDITIIIIIKLLGLVEIITAAIIIIVVLEGILKGEG